MDRVRQLASVLLFALALTIVGAVLSAFSLLAPSRTEAGDQDPICKPEDAGTLETTMDEDECEEVTPTLTSVAFTATNTTVPSSTPTNTTVPSSTPTNTVEASSTATLPAEASSTNTAVPTETATATEIPATSTESAIIVVTNTPEATSEAAVQEVTVVSGVQGGGEPTATVTQQVAGVSSLPATGTESSGRERDNGILYFGLGLMVLGGALAITKIRLERR